MTKSSVSIHSDKPFVLRARYQGETDTAVLLLSDSDWSDPQYECLYNDHVTLFMDGVYSDRLERAVKAFNEILHAPYKDAYDEDAEAA